VYISRLVSATSEFAKGQIPLRYPTRELVADQLRTGVRQVCDLDSVMEFGHNSAVSCGILPVSCGFQTVSDYQYHPRSNWPPSERCEIVVENNGE